MGEARAGIESTVATRGSAPLDVARREVELAVELRGDPRLVVRILFVCLGNICRSPTAHGVFRHLAAQSGLADRVVVDSAGTADYHPGKPADARSQRAAAQRGYDLRDLRARVVIDADFEQFDYILAMDDSNLRDLLARCPAAHRAKIHLFMSFAPELDRVAVPDPYFGGAEGFETVLDLVEAASTGLLERLRLA